MRRQRVPMIVLLLISAAGTLRAQETLTAEDLCLAARQQAAGIYAACQANEYGQWQTTLSAFGLHDSYLRWRAGASSCRTAYIHKWETFQVAFPGTICAGPRFVDNGDGTVTDNLTASTWVKDTPSTGYTWSASYGDKTASGTVFTVYLEGLNREGGCFADQCDWRLPTLVELQTLLNRPWGQCHENGNICRWIDTDEVCECSVCAINAEAYYSSVPCIDPIFGARASYHWVIDEAYSDLYLVPSGNARIVSFSNGQTDLEKGKYSPGDVRAIRGGL